MVQVLVNKGRASAGVSISPVAPNAMLSLEWDFLKNSTTILNPFKGDDPQEMDAERFHDVFANTLTPEENQAAWERTVVHESRNVLRSALGKAGRVDFAKPHVPLLLISGEEDRIIPQSLVRRNFSHYEDADETESGTTYLQEFPGRSHFLCGESGWEEVATSIANWLETQGVAFRPDESASVHRTADSI